jgi:hypothetical protein
MKLLSYELRRPEYCDFSLDGTFLLYFKKFHEMLPYLDLMVANDCGLPTSFYDQSLFEGIYPGPISVIIHAMAHHQLSNQKAIQALSEQTGDYPEAHRLLADVYTSEGETALAEQHMQLAATGGDLIAQKKRGLAAPALEEKTIAFFSQNPETQNKKPENVEVDTLPSHSEPVPRMG